MADRRSFQQDQTGEPPALNGVYPQWQPGQLGQTPAIADSTSTPQLVEGWQGLAARTVPIVPSQSQAQQTPKDQLPTITDPRDLYLPAEQTVPDIALQGLPNPLSDFELPVGAMEPGQLPQYELPGLIFGTDFQWDFNPTSTEAAGIWSQMSPQSWLDTSDGWNAMLQPESPDRPESPNPTEGDLSVDSHLVHYIPKTPSVLSLNDDEHVEEDGRKYHRYHEGRYLLPNDELEQDRLDLQHAAYTMLFHGELSLAPTGEPKRVLDLATGTGIWAIQFAEKHPNATVIGTDLSPIQPNAKPENCRFWVEDSEDPWHFEVPFDYIHARLVCSCFNDPRSVIQQAYDNLEPGGWIEFQDVDSILHCDDDTLAGTELEKLLILFTEGARSLGRNVRVSELYKSWMIEIGFEDVVERKFKLPGNSWPKDPYAKQIGCYEGANIKDAIDGISRAALKRGLGISEAERRKLSEQAKFDCCNPAVHWYAKVYVVYGRKPINPFDIRDASDVPGIPTSLAGIGTSFC